MSEEHPHPLLAQLPLTVSPFLSLPSGTTLPYSYKQLPSTLPPSITDPAPPPEDPTMTSQTSSQQPPAAAQQPQQATYVVSQSGHSAHPDSIIASCRALQEHLAKLQDNARATLAKWEIDIRERELAEKRRVAPGWLDVEAGQRMLVPERLDHSGHGGQPQNLMDQAMAEADGVEKRDEGEELDRAFGGMAIR